MAVDCPDFARSGLGNLGELFMAFVDFIPPSICDHLGAVNGADLSWPKSTGVVFTVR